MKQESFFLIQQAADLLQQGRLVAFPTETVYGLGADACNEAAVRAIFAAKNRPADHPLIVHIADVSQLSQWAMDVPPAAMILAEKFWPGPLTMIFKKQLSVLDVVTGGQSTVGVRIPRHPVARALLNAFGGGVAAPSANQFTHLSPTSAKDVEEELKNKVDLILDGGMCDVGLESTIVDMTKAIPVILRPGMITAEMISNTLGIPVTTRAKEIAADVRTPGMHHLHYAPTTKTMLVDADNILSKLSQTNDKQIALLSHHPLPSPLPSHIHVIPMPSTAAHYAHDLYHTLRELDHQHFDCILIAEVPADAEWEAIRDRLKKATGGAIF